MKVPGEDVLSELVLKEGGSEDPAALIVEPEIPPDAQGFDEEFDRALQGTEADVRDLHADDDETLKESWTKARELVQTLRPVPWFIWRLSNYVFSSPGQTKTLTDGGLIGLRRLVFAAASDPFLGTGRKVNSIHRAIDILSPDVIAAVAVIHGVCRRLAVCQFERIWRPILDDAILRAQIGFLVGERNPSFGAGRGMLAGFAGRSGLALLIATGELEQARRALEMLAAGSEISTVGEKVYGVQPLQVSAMVLSAAGCGRDAAFGTVRYATPTLGRGEADSEQFRWLSAFTITECIRTNRVHQVGDEYWEALGYMIGQDRGDLVAVTETMLCKGHTLPWIL
jgi:hypothetical protein